MGSQQKKKKRTKDPKSTTSEIKRTQDLDANRLALQPNFEIGHSPLGVGTTSYINVEDRIHSTQTNAPAGVGQVTGLTVTPQGGSNTQLNLAWTAVSGATSYNVYRSLTSGFSTDTPIAEPVTNSYQNTGLISGTTYYYRVSAENIVGEGTDSSEVSGTTTGSPPAMPMIVSIPMNGSLTPDSGGILVPMTISSTGVTFGSPGKFGSNYAIYNPTGAEGDITFYDDNSAAFPGSTPFVLDPNVGFTVSFWIRPTNLPTVTDQRTILALHDDMNGPGNRVFFYLDPSTSNQIGAYSLLNGLTSGSRVHQTALSNNTWYHIVATYKLAVNFATDFKLYVDKVVDNGNAGPPVALTFASSGQMISIGGSPVNANRYFQGGIDEIRVWQGQATQTQINNIFATNNP